VRPRRDRRLVRNDCVVSTRGLEQWHIECWVRTNGPTLKHQTSEPAIPFIKREGLSPRALRDSPGAHRGPMSSRPSCAYLYTPYGDGASKSPTLTVSIDDLNPGLLRSDEDWIGGHGLHYGGTGLDELPQFRNVLWPGKAEQVGEWGDRWSEIIDQPEWVLHSMKQGALAYEGVIPFSALSFTERVDEMWLEADVNATFDPLSWRSRSPPFLHQDAIWVLEERAARWR
jgi:hypothetical protein